MEDKNCNKGEVRRQKSTWTWNIAALTARTDLFWPLCFSGKKCSMPRLKRPPPPAHVFVAEHFFDSNHCVTSLAMREHVDATRHGIFKWPRHELTFTVTWDTCVFKHTHSSHISNGMEWHHFKKIYLLNCPLLPGQGIRMVALDHVLLSRPRERTGTKWGVRDQCLDPMGPISNAIVCANLIFETMRA